MSDHHDSHRRSRRGALTALAAAALLTGCAGRSGAAAPGAADGDGEQTPPDLAFLEGKTLRVVPSGGAMTMDYRPDRLTIVLDDQEKIERAYVG